MVGMSEILKEITVWQSDFSVPNHTYLLDSKGNIIAHARASDGIVVESKSKTIKLDKRYRKFINVNHSELSKLTPKDDGHDYSPKVGVRIFKVKSGNHDYKIEVAGSSITCSCIGFGYRGKCKHAEAVRSKL